MSFARVTLRLALTLLAAGALFVGLMLIVALGSYYFVVGSSIALSAGTGRDTAAFLAQFSGTPLFILRCGTGALVGATIAALIGGLGTPRKPWGKLALSLGLAGMIIAALIPSLNDELFPVFKRFVHLATQSKTTNEWDFLSEREKAHRQAELSRDFVLADSEVRHAAGTIQTVSLVSSSKPNGQTTRLEFDVQGSKQPVIVVLAMSTFSDGPEFRLACVIDADKTARYRDYRAKGEDPCQVR